MYKVGVLTVSDRCSQGLSQDKSGPKLVEMISNNLGRDWVVTQQTIVPDEKDVIAMTLLHWCDKQGLALVLTTGGTGFAPRDVTPEATKEVIQREAPGLVHAMMSGSLSVTPMAMLSRLTAGIRGKTLIINLPGSTKGAAENFQYTIPALKHGLDVLLDNKQKVEDHHNKGHHVCPHRETNDLVTNVASRPRKSPYPMISVEEAQNIVLEYCEKIPLETEDVTFKQALDRILVQDVKSHDSLPPFPASIKDGYAVISSDKAGPRKVIGASNAGNAPEDHTLQPGECIRINTGAPVPPGSDAVVQVEDTELTKTSEDGLEELEIKILVEPLAGQDIRPIGSDIEKGSIILAKGTILGPAEIGLLATVGAISVKVFKKPTIALLSTGNELQNPDEKELKRGFIRDSNKSTLCALIDAEHGFPTFDCGIATDNLQDLRTKLSKAFDYGTLVVTTGGVSMGDRDLLRQVLVKDFDATIHFARVHMKPGKPTTFATLQWNDQTKLVLGLPGNPVSATVTSHLYVLPAARKLSGNNKPFAAKIKARLSCDISLDPRPEYYRVILSWRGEDSVAIVESTGNQISSRLASLRAANGLLMLPPKSEDRKMVKKGEIFNAIVIGQLFQ